MEPVDVSLTAIFRIRIVCCESIEIGTPRRTISSCSNWLQTWSQIALH
jgi:hypothetical protein